MHPDLPPEFINQIVTGDARELSPRIPDASIDLIFTDPPYLKEYLYLYEWLAKEAARVLKPGGFVLAMCGGTYLNRIFRMFDDSGLMFFWKYELLMTDQAAGIVWMHNGNGKAMPINTRSKPIIAYSKGIATSRTGTLGLFGGTGADKRFHIWGQDESSTRYYIDCFSDLGELVLDPFTGGGTTPAMCRMLNRNFIAFEQDPDTAETARARIINFQPDMFIHPPVQSLLW